MSKTVIKLFFLLFLMCPSFESYGMLLAECRDIDFVTQKADIIIQGEVTKVEVQRNSKGHIHTYVTVKVSKYVKGEGEWIITVKLPGGMPKDGDSGVWVEDTPSFEVGQTGYLCLEKLPNYDDTIDQFYGPVCGHGMMESLSK